MQKLTLLTIRVLQQMEYKQKKGKEVDEID